MFELIFEKFKIESSKVRNVNMLARISVFVSHELRNLFKDNQTWAALPECVKAAYTPNPMKIEITTKNKS